MGAVIRPIVRFGRQKEQSRETRSNNFKDDDVMEGIFLPVGVDLRQITIIPKAEWQRIQDSITAPAREIARIRAERKERKDLHMKSQALVKNWTNTIAGMSQMKLKAKKVRQERQEEERRKIDLEEAKYAEQKRKEMIEQAKLVQHYESERVKGFHRAFLLTEVLKERDAQIAFKKIKENLYTSKNEAIERERQKAIQKEEEKAKERHAKRMQLNSDQLAQIKEHEHLEELNRLEEKREGEEIRAMTKLYEMEMQKKQEEEREEKLRRRRAHQAHVADQIILEAIEKQKQEEEDDKIRTHLKAKQAMNKLKKAKEEEIHRLMEEERDRITSRLLAQMKQQRDDEDERIARAVAEAEEERERDLKAREEKNQADLRSIAEHRIGVIKRKEEQEKQEKLEAQETLRGLMEADRIYQELEKDKIHRNHCANLKLQEYHVMQIAEKVGREERAKQEEIEYDRQKELIALYKEQEFQKYARKVIEEESKTTRHLYPLLRVAREGIPEARRPVYCDQLQSEDRHATKLPYLGETAQEMKLLNECEYDHTKARLGFTW